jgi:hypothetical protein
MVHDSLLRFRARRMPGGRQPPRDHDQLIKANRADDSGAIHPTVKSKCTQNSSVENDNQTEGQFEPCSHVSNRPSILNCHDGRWPPVVDANAGLKLGLKGTTLDHHEERRILSSSETIPNRSMRRRNPHRSTLLQGQGACTRRRSLRSRVGYAVARCGIVARTLTEQQERRSERWSALFCHGFHLSRPVRRFGQARKTGAHNKPGTFL